MNEDLISRSALLELYADTENIHFAVYNVPIPVVRQNILDAPAVDAVEVVRCRYCEYWKKAKVNKKGFLICPASGMEITARDFCSYGERRSDDADE